MNPGSTNAQPTAASAGNVFLNGQAGGVTTVITGYSDRPSYSLPYFLTRPGVKPGQATGLFPQPSSLQYQVEGGIAADRQDVRVILAELAKLDANDPAAYKEKEDLLKKTRFNSWEDFFDSASFSDMPWEEYLVYRAETDDRLYGSGGGGGPFSQTSTQVTLSSESEAARIIDSAFTEYLGRTATDEEVTAWQEALNAAQRANPVTSTTTGYRGSNTSTSNTVTETGFDPARFAREYSQSQEGFAERFAGLTFMGAIDRMISQARGSLDEFAEGIQ